MRHEIILLGDQTHRSRAVGLDRGAEIAFDELAGEMQCLRVDDLDIAGGVQRAGDAGYEHLFGAILDGKVAGGKIWQRSCKGVIR